MKVILVLALVASTASVQATQEPSMSYSDTSSPTSGSTSSPTSGSTSSPTSDPASISHSAGSTCGSLKQVYAENVCCQTQGGSEDKLTRHQVIPAKMFSLDTGDNLNKCMSQALSDIEYFDDVPCSHLTTAGLVYQAVEQSGAIVTYGWYGQHDASQDLPGQPLSREPTGEPTSGYTSGSTGGSTSGSTGDTVALSEGDSDTVALSDDDQRDPTGEPTSGSTSGSTSAPSYDQWTIPARVPITTSFFDAVMCPVNVHWSLGSEHYSADQYDLTRNYDNSPLSEDSDEDSGYFCHHYNETDTKFTEPYDWQFCKEMAVGETYEVKWPHSAAGSCNTPDQYQTPFYDGIFCDESQIQLYDLHKKVGVQAQVFTIVNDEHYYYPDLIKGMIVEGEYGTQITYYTGSTTGKGLSNEVCSRMGPLTWQVDRTCHLISASSFDKMCADMLQQRDDMSGDTQPHSSRKLPPSEFTANNQNFTAQQRRREDGYENSGFVYAK